MSISDIKIQASVFFGFPLSNTLVKPFLHTMEAPNLSRPCLLQYVLMTRLAVPTDGTVDDIFCTLNGFLVAKFDTHTLPIGETKILELNCFCDNYSFISTNVNFQVVGFEFFNETPYESLIDN